MKHTEVRAIPVMEVKDNPADAIEKAAYDAVISQIQKQMADKGLILDADSHEVLAFVDEFIQDCSFRVTLVCPCESCMAKSIQTLMVAVSVVDAALKHYPDSDRLKGLPTEPAVTISHYSEHMHVASLCFMQAGNDKYENAFANRHAYAKTIMQVFGNPELLQMDGMDITTELRPANSAAEADTSGMDILQTMMNSPCLGAMPPRER